MKLYCNQCHMPLLIRHTVQLELSSEFDYKPDMLTLTNHHIYNSKDTNAFLETPKSKTFYCMDCNADYKIQDSKFRCDDCGSLFGYKAAKEVGESLVICNACLNSNKTLDFFKIFGKRGPSKTTRDTRAREALEEARVEVPAEQIMEELDAFTIAMDRARIEAGQQPVNPAELIEENVPPDLAQDIRDRNQEEGIGFDDFVFARQNVAVAPPIEFPDDAPAIVFGDAPIENNPDGEDFELEGDE